jgi:hypothetical protein
LNVEGLFFAIDLHFKTRVAGVNFIFTFAYFSRATAGCIRIVPVSAYGPGPAALGAVDFTAELISQISAVISIFIVVGRRLRLRID